MNIDALKTKIDIMPPFRVDKTIICNSSEHYELFNDKCRVCSFDFTNYKGIDGFLSHGEVKNFNIETPFRRKKDAVKAIFQSQNIITELAKEKKIKFVMFTVPIPLYSKIVKLIKRLGIYEYSIEDLENRNFIQIINPEYFKNIKRRLFSIIPVSEQNVKSIENSCNFLV